MMVLAVHIDAFVCELSLHLGPSGRPISAEVERRTNRTNCLNFNWLTRNLVYIF